MDQEQIKKNLGKTSANLVKNGMVVGLGTGTTARYFIEFLGERCRNEDLSIKAIASSKQSADLARSSGITLIEEGSVNLLDLTVDGADQVDPAMRLIKGLGGALLREKVLAKASKRVVIVVDESKMVSFFKGKVPTEVVPFALPFVERSLKNLGLKAEMRKVGSNPVLTDNGNLILDIDLKEGSPLAYLLEEPLKQIPGLLETGFFLNEASEIMVGYPDGRVDLITRGAHVF